MDIGIFARTFQAPNSEVVFRKIAQHQIRLVHYNMACSGLSELPDHIPKRVSDSIAQQASQWGLSLIGVSATFNMIHPDRQLREEGLRAFEAISSRCKVLGTRFVSLCTGSRNPVDKWKYHPDNLSWGAWKDLLGTMEKVLVMAEKNDVLVGIEPELGNVVSDTDRALGLIKELTDPRIRIIFDPANLFLTAQSGKEINLLIAHGVEKLHPYIEVIHGKDRAMDGTIQPAGAGAVDFPYLLKQIKSCGLDVPIILHGLEEKQVHRAAAHLREVSDQIQATKQ